jgi:MoaA/NifB/PqqE/SkfB family radical SAM enzyme
MNQGQRQHLILLSKIPFFMLSRISGAPPALPPSVTVSLLYSCNSRCKTCNVYEKSADRFSLEEFERTFASLGNAPFWFTMSGGEPFLRQDIVEICRLAYKYCTPSIINIPTNGSLHTIIPQRVEAILEDCPESELIINVSLDEVGEKHDEIRGFPKSFERAMITYKALKELTTRYEHFTLGIHTVISKFNVENLPAVYEELQRLEPDSYITEIAEERVELDTIGAGITPSPEAYGRAIDVLSNQIKRHHFSGVSKTTQSFRLEYYELVKKILARKTQVIPCYAGIVSAQISPQGDVWPCCVRADSMGNLRENDYDFRKIWQSPEAKKIRNSIRRKDCHCPLANAAYTNILCSPISMLKVLAHIFTSGRI